MKKNLFISVLILAIVFMNVKVFSQRNNQKSVIQVALILDTSNSMDGLIDQAKTQLWSVVNKLATARYKGEMPDLQIALYEYGNDGLPADEGYLRQVLGLTTDLDKVSEALFALKTNGGSEFCGYVIDKATVQLQWSKSNEHLKMIFIAGNEEFTQGDFDYKKACKNAVSEGIIVNTIFCGSQEEGINLMWKDAADISDGKYLNIDQTQAVAYIDSPFDAEIVKMNEELNKTYIAFGSSGDEYKSRQTAQDANAAGVSAGVAVSRAVSKSSNAYKNSDWDLVDAMQEKEVDMKDIKEEELPEEMKKMNDKEKIEYVETKSKERTEIQAKIADLNAKREEYVNKVKAETKVENTLGDAMIEAVSGQAIKMKYTFEK